MQTRSPLARISTRVPALNTQAVAADAPLGDRLGMGFAGTLVTQGQARAVVVATGAHTEMGRIGHMLSEVEEATTPLLRKMEVVGRSLTGELHLPR